MMRKAVITIIAASLLLLFGWRGSLSAGGADVAGSMPASATASTRQAYGMGGITTMPDRQPLPGVKALVDKSTDVALVEVLKTQPRLAVEGGRDNVSLKVIESLKGELTKGAEFRIYYHLRWVSEDPLRCEDPKFIEGNQYIVFAVKDSIDYVLTDPWVSIARPHPNLAATIRDMVKDPNLWKKIMERQQWASSVAGS